MILRRCEKERWQTVSGGNDGDVAHMSCTGIEDTKTWEKQEACDG
jgi:hypothetical protein